MYNHTKGCAVRKQNFDFCFTPVSASSMCHTSNSCEWSNVCGFHGLPDALCTDNPSAWANMIKAGKRGIGELGKYQEEKKKTTLELKSTSV